MSDGMMEEFWAELSGNGNGLADGIGLPMNISREGEKRNKVSIRSQRKMN